MLSYIKKCKGDGKKRESLILLHGLGGKSSGFKNQIDILIERYDLILIDLNGHGLSADYCLYTKECPSFVEAAKDVLKVMDYEKIEKAHFMGLSLGTMVIFALSTIAPERIISMVMTGAIVGYPIKGKILFIIGNILRNIVPYTFLYAFFAYLLMPRKNHRKSRKIFIEGSKKLGKNEFFAWFDCMRTFEKKFPMKILINNNIPKMFIIGKQDHMFIKAIKKYVALDKTSKITIINNCGHVANIDATEEFNEITLTFYNLLYSSRKSAGIIIKERQKPELIIEA